jgi:methionine synthase II (cobalamin-independent)
MASPYRADHVGSLLRPPDLLQARADHAEGTLGAARLREVENASILRAVELRGSENSARPARRGWSETREVIAPAK